MVESVDDAVGNVMDALVKKGIEDKTVVMFTSDNGGFARATSNAPLRANKGSHYEGGIRVPLIVRAPGIEAGVCDVPVISNDLYPTVLDLVGLNAKPHQHVDGVNLVPLLEGGKIDRSSIFWHYPHYNRHPSSAPVTIVRNGDWKLIKFLETEKFELYDLGKDLGEKNDLAKARP